MWIFEFSLGVCSMELRSFVSSLEYLVSNGRQVIMGGIRLGGSATYVSLLRSFFASRPYNYGLCGVLGRRIWKAYLECLYCKVKVWIHGGKQHTNMIKSSSVWIWVEGWLLKDSLSKSRWLRSWAIFDAHPLFFFFLLDTFFTQLSFFIFSNSLFCFYNI